MYKIAICEDKKEHQVHVKKLIMNEKCPEFNDIYSILQKYFDDRHISAGHQKNLLPSTNFVKRQIDNNKPYILFGRLDNPRGGKVNHAVLVYGYENDHLIAHFGWNCLSDIRINGIWGSGYATILY